MAKKRKMKSSPVRRSRKRMSGVAGGTADTLKQALFIVGGMAASKLIVNAIGKVAPTILGTPVAKAGGQIVLGVLTKPLTSAIGVKSSNINSLGTGMIVGGSYELVKTFAPKVLGQTDEGDVVIISGSDELSELNGMDELGNAMELSELNGMDEIGEMFEIGY
jgi:hypothetical protein